MGKSADAVFDGNPSRTVADESHLVTPFLTAAAAARAEAGSCDGMLVDGSIAHSATEMLLLQSGEMNPNAHWSAAKVQSLQDCIDWSKCDPQNAIARAAIASAKAFLQTCAEQGLAIQFDS